MLLQARESSHIFAAIIATTAWAGLLVQFVDTHHGYSAADTFWILLAYFTVLTNLVVASVFTGLALNQPSFRSPGLLAGTTLSIVLVGTITAILLRNAIELSGGSVPADWLLHRCTPLLVPLFWALCVPKGQLRPKDPLLWAIYPLLYLAYALTRGAITGRYAYPFLDRSELGWARTTLNAVLIALAFMTAAYALVWLDDRLARYRGALD